jgi:hypothetical protein
MATSQNGWPASSDRSAIHVAPFEVAGVSFPGGVRSGDVATVLGYVATEIHARVERLHVGWCWGHAYREVRASTGLSNHASGTAIDINAPKHPLGSRGTFSPAARVEIHRILSKVGVVRWGGDYVGRVDEMHFEINAPAGAVATAANQLRAQSATSELPATRESDDMIVTVATPNRCGVLSGGMLLDITGDSGARKSAQSAINRNVVAELQVTEDTWNRLAAATHIQGEKA